MKKLNNTYNIILGYDFGKHGIYCGCRFNEKGVKQYELLLPNNTINALNNTEFRKLMKMHNCPKTLQEKEASFSAGIVTQENFKAYLLNRLYTHKYHTQFHTAGRREKMWLLMDEIALEMFMNGQY